MMHLKQKWTAAQEQLLIEKYSTASWDELETILNRSISSISRKANRLGLHKEHRSTYASCNETFFDVLDKTSAYVLGLWFADGYMYNAARKFRVSITLKGSDSYLIHRIAELWQAPVYKGVYNGFSRTTVQVNSEYMFNRLLELGGTPRKSLTLKFPKIDEELYPHFIRGYFDGDGCFTTRKQYNVDGTYSTWGRVTMLGTESFLASVQSILDKSVGALGVIDAHGTNIKELRLYTGCYQSLYHYLYDDADIWLTRKKGRFEAWLGSRGLL